MSIPKVVILEHRRSVALYVATTAIYATITPLVALAHPGRTASDGCHYLPHELRSVKRAGQPAPLPWRLFGTFVLYRADADPPASGPVSGGDWNVEGHRGEMTTAIR
jgi:hypothetical protein